MAALMRSRLFLRRTTAAAGIYASVGLGFLATVIAAHRFSTTTFGLYALVLSAAGFFQSLLDLTVEEALVKYGFRFATREDWGRLHGLFRSALRFKLIGAVVAALALLGLAPLADQIFHESGLGPPIAVAALIPLAQFPEGTAGVALVLRERYDLRAFFLGLSMALRLAAVAVGTAYGLTETIVGIVVAQVVATSAISVAGYLAFRRFPHARAERLGDERRGVLSFLGQSSVATMMTSLTSPLAILVLGRVASATEVAYFRVALAPQQGLGALSAPARLILMTEQTRDWERGTPETVFAGIRRFMLGATVISAVVLPPLLVFTPDLVRIFFSAKNLGAVDATRIVLIAGVLRLIYGWTKSFPVSIGRPNLRIWTHGVETIVLVPLVAVLGSEWGATGAAGAVLASSVAFCAYWTLLYLRIRREPDLRITPPSPAQEVAVP
jgi:O-antigen/teichoic acid export membrane protein